MESIIRADISSKSSGEVECTEFLALSNCIIRIPKRYSLLFGSSTKDQILDNLFDFGQQWPICILNSGNYNRLNITAVGQLWPMCPKIHIVRPVTLPIKLNCTVILSNSVDELLCREVKLNVMELNENKVCLIWVNITCMSLKLRSLDEAGYVTNNGQIIYGVSFLNLAFPLQHHQSPTAAFASYKRQFPNLIYLSFHGVGRRLYTNGTFVQIFNHDIKKKLIQELCDEYTLRPQKLIKNAYYC
jgi:hypothetical protein